MVNTIQYKLTSVNNGNIFLGTVDNVNEAGVTYYKNLIQELVDNDIIPMVTIYHFDLPEVLQDEGGWVVDSIVNRFADYARVVFQAFGDDVKYWMTFNEPKQTCLLGYEYGSMAPGYQHPGTDVYLCVHNVIRAHAAAYRIYDEEFRSTQNGNDFHHLFFGNLYRSVYLQGKFPL